ncbi:MAG: hypothetical protein K2X48_17225 [Chitinophagaceae bacterium]|nr:hypothetical protein [Chitinophagaceae bacterium]
MKKILSILIAGSFVWSGCDKEPKYNAEFAEGDLSTTAFVKFVNAYSYATPVFAGQTTASFQLTYNGAQFSATPIGLGAAFPASPNYAAISREFTQKDMTVRLALGTPPAAVRDSVLFTFKPNFSLGRYYTFFLCDSVTNESRRILITEDDVREPGGTALYRIRFANLIPNMPTATPTLELFSFRARAAIFTGIPARGVTPFIEVPVQGVNVADTFQIRYTGSTTALATLNTVATNGQQSLTVFARGFVGATGTRAPTISTYRNR